MPVKNHKHRQMIIKSPSTSIGHSNPSTCLSGTAQKYKAVAMSGTTAGDSTFSFDFYANSNLKWPPTSDDTPWIQPLQYCIPMSNGSEKYENINLYMYTFSNTDSSTPSSYKTIGWLNFKGTIGSQDTYSTSFENWKVMT